jgi:hypothetical protein
VTNCDILKIMNISVNIDGDIDEGEEIFLVLQLLLGSIDSYLTYKYPLGCYHRRFSRVPVGFSFPCPGKAG